LFSVEEIAKTILTKTRRKTTENEEQNELDGTRRASVNGCNSACCDLDIWPFDTKS